MLVFVNKLLLVLMCYYFNPDYALENLKGKLNSFE